MYDKETFKSKNVNLFFNKDGIKLLASIEAEKNCKD